MKKITLMILVFSLLSVSISLYSMEEGAQGAGKNKADVFPFNNLSFELQAKILGYCSVSDSAKYLLTNNAEVSRKKITKNEKDLWVMCSDIENDCNHTICYNPHDPNKMVQSYPLLYGTGINILNLQSGEIIKEVEVNDNLFSLCCNPRNPHELAFGIERGIMILNLKSEEIKRLKLADRYGKVLCVCYNPHDLNEIAAGTAKGIVYTCNSVSGKIIKRREVGHLKKILCLSFNPHIRHELAFGTNRGTIHIWNLVTESRKVEIGHGGSEIISLCYNRHIPHELAFLTGTRNNSDLCLWNLLSGEITEASLCLKSFSFLCYNPHIPNELALGRSGKAAVEIGSLSEIRTIQKWFDEGFVPKKASEDGEEVIRYFTFINKNGQQYEKPINLLKYSLLLKKIEEGDLLTLSEEDKAYLNMMPVAVREAVAKTLKETKRRHDNPRLIPREYPMKGPWLTIS